MVHSSPASAGEITSVLMPQMGLEVSEATVLEILVAVGDAVGEGVVLLEVETDKAIAEVVAPTSGFVLTLEVEVGETVPVGALLVQLGDEHAEPEKTSLAPPTASTKLPRSTPAEPLREAMPSPVIRAAPVARRAAAARRLALEAITGTGPRGRITLRDVETAAEAADLAAATHEPTSVGSDNDEPIGRLRLAVARRMSQSQLIPQYHLERDVDARHLLAEKDARGAVVGHSPTVGLNDLLVQAIGDTVARHPLLASTFVEAAQPALRHHPEISVGLAVATERGLVVPVIRNVPGLGLTDIATERQRLVAAARAGRLKEAEVSGASVTLSNLGSFGVDRFAAMLNPGESSIVAVGRATERVVARDRGFAVVPLLTVTMTFDHRVIDGAVGAAGLGQLAELLEGAMTWRP